MKLCVNGPDEACFYWNQTFDYIELDGATGAKLQL